MGAAPLGYLANPVEVRLAANMQAMTTHSIMTAPYAQIIALAAHYFIYHVGSKAGLIPFLAKEVEGAASTLQGATDVPEGKSSMGASAACIRVLQLLHAHDTLSGMIRQAVDLGGDTDSAAALAVAIGSCSPEFAHDLPESLVRDLECGNIATHQRLRTLDQQLVTRSNSRTKTREPIGG